MKRILQPHGATALLVLLLALPGRMMASLGGRADSVQADQIHLQASLRTVAAQGYTMNELHAPTGMMVREFVSPAGVVFGLAWEGPWFPDMRQLLGSHFEEFTQALSQNGSHGRRPIEVTLPTLVVHIAGHPRHYAGQAYLPDMLPQGMKAEEIR